MESKSVISAYKKGYRVLVCGGVVNQSGEMVRLTKNSRGYLKFSIRHNKKSVTVFVHQLQAFQKYGDALYKSGVLVRHINGNPMDNSYQNIEIGSHSDNMMDIPESVRYAKSLHASSFVQKHDAQKIAAYYLGNGKSYKKTMQHFGISSKGTLNYILKKRAVL